MPSRVIRCLRSWCYFTVLFSLGGSLPAQPLDDPLPDIPTGTLVVTPQLFAGGLPVEEVVLTFGVQWVGPTDLAEIPGGTRRLAVTTYGGQVLLVDGNGNQYETPFLDLATESSPSFSADFEVGEAQGLTSVAFHPDFAVPTAAGHRRFYTIEAEFAGSGVPDFDGSTTSTRTGSHHDEVVYEYTLSSVDAISCDLTCVSSKREVMRVLQPGWHHNFGDLAFDAQNHLFVSSGDGSTSTTTAPIMSDNSQILTNVFGKMLRIDPLGTNSPNGQYGIPDSNPFVDGAGGQVDEIFAYGLRNPYRVGFDKLTGDLYVSETGENKVESVDKIVRGGNYGWNFKEGSFLYDKSNKMISIDEDLNNNGIGDVAEELNLIEPVLEYDHGDGRAIVGGVLYRGRLLPALRGKYVFADLTTARLFYGDPQTGEMFEFSLDPSGDPLPGQIHSVNEDADGEIYVLGRQSLGGGEFDGWVMYLAAEPCDFDLDGNCTVADLNALLGEGPVAAGVPVTAGENDQYDLTGDGLIDNDDVDQWLGDAATSNGFASPFFRGDANLDGLVDASDFNRWNANKFTATLLWDRGNFNGDGVVDASDFNQWNANKFMSSNDVREVPEPTWIALVLPAIMMNVLRRRELR